MVYALVTGQTIARSVSYSKDYIGNKEYVNGKLSRIDVPGGYIKVSGNTQKVYGYQSDYLGSNRVVLDASNGNNVVQYMRYYPFGLQQRESYWQELQPYKYSGKEYISFGGSVPISVLAFTISRSVAGCVRIRWRRNITLFLRMFIV